MSGYKVPVILFFIRGMSPSEDEAQAAKSIGYVRFRNVSAIVATDKAEKCDGVSAAEEGVIPAQYDGKPVVTSLADVMDIMKEKQEAEDAAARVVAPSSEVVGKTGKGKKETAGNPLAKTAWSPNG